MAKLIIRRDDMRCAMQIGSTGCDVEYIRRKLIVAGTSALEFLDANVPMIGPDYEFIVNGPVVALIDQCGRPVVYIDILIISTRTADQIADVVANYAAGEGVENKCGLEAAIEFLRLATEPLITECDLATHANCSKLERVLDELGISLPVSRLIIDRFSNL